MSKLSDDEEVEPPCIHIISDSEDSGPNANGFIGYPSAQKRFPTDVEPAREPPSLRKKLKFDGDRLDGVEDIPIDIDSISTNPRRTRTKVSSNTSSKFPVSSPSDTMPVAGHRKKYIKNTLPAGAFERMLNDVALNHPLMTFQEKLSEWKCCVDLSDVEDVNNFDDLFEKRETLYKKNNTGRRNAGKESPDTQYNYKHFRTVILESFRGSPVLSTSSLEMKRKQINADQPSCSKCLETIVVPANDVATATPPSSAVIQYEKILCPSSDSSVTKASPSIRLHWTDEESVFRFNRLNPEIDKYSHLIKMRIDYKKQINLKAKMNQIFKTPTVPTKYNSGYDSPEQRSIIEATNEAKPLEEDANEAAQKVTDKKIVTRRSTGSKSSDSRRTTGRRSTEQSGTDKLAEVSSFQQDEFCNYLGLGMNGKVYSPTPTDNKRRSLRVKRQQQQVETIKKKNEKKETKKEKDVAVREKKQEEQEKTKEEEVTTTVNETRNSLSSPLSIKTLERTTPENLNPTPPPQSHIIPHATATSSKTPEIKILVQIRNSSTPRTTRQTTSTATTTNSAPQPIRRIRRTRATSNGTSTCPRSSQSDESPSKAAPRRRRLQHHTRRNNHASDLSESLLSDPQLREDSPTHNGRASTVPSSEGRKEELPSTSHPDVQEGEDSLHKKFQRYLEESRKNKPSIFILDSIDNNGSKVEETTTNNNNIPTDHAPIEKKTVKAKYWPKKRRIIHRRLLRRNGILSGTLHQRILRNRTVVRPLRAKISKHPMRKKIRTITKKPMEAHLAESKVVVTKMKSDTEELKPVDDKSDSDGMPTENLSTEHVEVIEEDENLQTENEIENTEEERCNMSQDDPLSVTTCQQAATELKTESVHIQTEACSPPLPISFLTSPSTRMQNPLTSENGPVIYAYYELEILTVVQDLVVTFWKTSKLIQVLSKSTCEWMYLGECKRLLYDEEIKAPYKNRICIHNSIPIYMEMRAKELSKERRDCNLISVYVNVYYYHDEDLVAKSHSIQLDTVASIPQSVVYTTITDSRYFIMCWSQENVLGKPRSGLCKYSLTPHLDTLASIREFKCMRHEIRYLECTTDDNLIGFGDTQVTLWNHRSGDILMNYDLDVKLGSNVGSIYYPSLEVGQDNTILIFQQTSAQELSVIAINISHNAPSHRFICTHILPPEFENLQSSMRTDDYIILTNAEHQELWIDCSDPHYLMNVKTQEHQCRFYARCKHNVIDIADDHLALETFSNFVLKMINEREK